MTIAKRITNIISAAKGVWTSFDSDDESFTSWISGKSRHKNRYQTLAEYKNLVYACIRAIAEDVAQYQMVLYTEDQDTGKRKNITNHPFLKLLENPNPDTTQYDFLFARQAYLELVGESFWYVSIGEITKRPKELYTMRPDLVQLVCNETTGKIEGYVYHREDGLQIPLDLEEVIYEHTFNPYNPHRGLGTVQAGQLYVDTENSASQFQYNYLHNQASPSGVLTLNNNMTPEAFKKVKEDWKSVNSGVDNAGKTLILRKTDASFTKMGLSLAELDLGTLESMNEGRILKLFRVPKPMLGETDSSGLGRGNVEAIEYIFAKKTIEPKLRKLDGTNKKTIQRYYKDNASTSALKVGHISQIPQDKEFELNQRSKSVDIWKTRNQIRAEDGDEPIEGGDELFTNFNQVPLNTPVATSASTGKRLVRLTLKPAKKKEAVQPFFDNLDKLEAKKSKAYERSLKSLLKTQEKEVLEQIQSLAGGKQVVTLQGFLFTLIFSREDLVVSGLLGSLIQAMEQAGQMGIDLTAPASTTFITTQGQRDAIFNSTDRLLKSFNEETALKIQKQLGAGLANNESAEQIARRIESIYEEATGYRAQRIAQTEIHKSVNYGVAESYRQAGVKEMIWRAQPGACEFCRAMDGTTTRIGVPFINKDQTLTGKDGGEFVADYDNITYADLHPNCDCKLEPVRVE